MNHIKWDKEIQNISPERKILKYFVVKKYDEASDANRTDKSPQKKMWHENTSNRRDKDGSWLYWYWNQEGIKYNNDST